MEALKVQRLLAYGDPVDGLTLELLERKLLREADVVLDLPAKVVKLLHMDDENSRTLLNREALLGVSLAKAHATVILVVPFQSLGGAEIVNALLKCVSGRGPLGQGPVGSRVLLRELKADAGEVLVGVCDVLAREALDLAPGLPAKNLEYRAFRLVLHDVTLSNRHSFGCFDKTGVDQSVNEDYKELMSVFLPFLPKIEILPDSAELAENDHRISFAIIHNAAKVLLVEAEKAVLSLLAYFLMLRVSEAEVEKGRAVCESLDDRVEKARIPQVSDR